MTAEAAAAKGPDFLFGEIAVRITDGPVGFDVLAQLADDGDTVDDATVHWPADRPVLSLGKIVLTARVADNVHEQQHIIFDPIPRVDGSESSDDPLTEVRADLSLLSGRRRRAVFGDGRQ